MDDLTSLMHMRRFVRDAFRRSGPMIAAHAAHAAGCTGDFIRAMYADGILCRCAYRADGKPVYDL